MLNHHKIKTGSPYDVSERAEDNPNHHKNKTGNPYDVPEWAQDNRHPVRSKNLLLCDYIEKIARPN